MCVDCFRVLVTFRNSLLHDTHGDAPIIGAALLYGVVCDGVLFPVTLRGQALSRNTLVDQLGYYGAGPLLGEAKIRISRTHIVGKAGDVQMDTRTTRKNRRNVIESALAIQA